MPDRPRSAPRQRTFWAFVVGVVVVGLALAFRERFWIDGATTFSLFDDAMISMRYGRNLAQGHGLVWNAGDASPVEGYTNLSWTLWMAALQTLPISIRYVSLLVIVTGLALLVVVLFAVRSLSRTIGAGEPSLPSWLPTAAVALTATSVGLLFWTERGMEVPLVAALGMVGLVLVTRIAEGATPRRIGLLALVVVALVISRPDTAPMIAILIVAATVVAPRADRVRVALVLIGAAVASLGLLTAFRVAYYGDALPNTYTLKVTGSPLGRRLAGSSRALRQDLIVYLAPPLVLAAAVLCHPVVRRSAIVRALAALVVTQIVYAWWVGGDAWEALPFTDRYVAVIIPQLAVLVALGIATLFAPDARVRRPARLLVSTATAIWCAVVIVWGRPSVVTEGYYYTSVSDPDVVNPVLAVGLVVALIVAAVTARRMLTSSRPAAPEPRPYVRRTGWLAAATVAVVVLVTGQQTVRVFWDHGLPYADCDSATARIGAAEAAATAPDAVIAVWWAGNGPFFSGRPALDALGKSDRHIARTEAHLDGPFHPGHDKSDVGYTVGTLRPDVVDLGPGLLGGLPPDQLEQYAAWGYTPVTPTILVRDDSTKVDRAALAQLPSASC